MTGKNLVILGISQGHIATESLYDDNGVRTIMERHREVGKKFRECEFGRILEKVDNRT